ncbi:c-type cytochrome [Desertibaculum subflavum]|uniref:c-type cytochrome n=1 Tax=Desertibaculum subflavum TaxID=2268458 RepID=UPI000E6698F2
MAWRRGALWVGGTLVALALGGLLFAASGIYNVAARSGHFDVTTWVIELVLRRSVALHARSAEAPNLDDIDRIRLGAAHFQGGCAPCHGAPGTARNPIVKGMLPVPPDLARAAETWSEKELFWIVRNGLKYTGMPAWSAPTREDEVWSVVAFLRRLPTMDTAGYRALAEGEAEPAVAQRAGWSPELLRCGRCHDTSDRPSASQLVPRLAGQSARYFAAALRAYKDEWRPSGIMQPIAAELDEAAIDRLAEQYARLPGLVGTAPTALADDLSQGRSIATAGVPEAGIPACLSCHASGYGLYPRLIGQSAAYIRQQLHLFQAGQREQTVLGQIMTPVARRLNDRQIQEVADFLASSGREPPGGDLSP